MNWIAENWLLAIAAVLMIAAMLATSIRNLRIGALLAGIAAMLHFALLQNWAALALIGLITFANGARFLALVRRSGRGDILDDERELFEHVMQVQDPAQHGRLRDLLTWEDVPEGAVLMREGEKAPPLIYIAHGSARIEHGGEAVGACDAGDFLGEMSVVSGEHASATVTVGEPMRIARFDRDALADLVRNLPELGKALDAALNRSLAAKVLRMNKTVTGQGE